MRSNVALLGAKGRFALPSSSGGRGAPRVDLELIEVCWVLLDLCAEDASSSSAARVGIVSFGIALLYLFCDICFSESDKKYEKGF